MSGERLNEADIRLFLAGALPRTHAWKFRIAMLVDRELRDRVQQVKQSDQLWQKQRMPELENKLQPAQRLQPFGVPKRNQSAAKSWVQGLGLGPRIALSMAIMVFCTLLGLQFVSHNGFQNGLQSGGEQFTAKGLSLGVQLYQKGDKTSKVKNFTARMSSTDTLQIIPMEKSGQFLAVYGWSAKEGLQVIFPGKADQMQWVSEGLLPPSIHLDEAGKYRLIAVSAQSQIKLPVVEEMIRDSVDRLIKRNGQPWLADSLYFQSYQLNVTD